MKKLNYLVKLTFISIIVNTIASCSSTNEKKLKPNVVFILVDDLGWRDLSYAGSKFYQTPHVDSLASKGVTFTNAYAASTVSSPTRAGILSGKYPATINCTDWITGHVKPFAKLKVPDWTMYLDTAEYTMAEAFRDAGYVTAHIGKFHLGEEETYWPDNQGFDINIAGWKMGRPLSYFSPYKNPKISDGPEGEYLTDRLAEEACNFIAQNKEQPFFLNLWFYNVHTPLQAKQETIDKYKAKVDSGYMQRNPVYAAMVEHTDDAVGRVVSELQKQGLLENTIIVFTSDNGGLVGSYPEYRVTSNLPLRSGKGSMYEGGVRVPAFIVAPGIATPGLKCDVPIISSDYFPTLMELTGVKYKDKVKNTLDGLSIVPLFKQNGSIDRSSIFWHYPHYHPEGAVPYSAIRKNQWKLIHVIENDSYELYNLKDDIGEENNLIDVNTERADSLKQELNAWRVKAGAQMPTLNPDYDKEKENLYSWQIK
ncbi:MAG: sulfatase [Bacteroidota bacterium]